MKLISIIQGNVVSPVEIKTNPNTGKSFGVLRLAVTTKKDATDYIDIIGNEGLAKVMQDYADVGRSVFVTGRPRLRPRKSDDGTIYPNMSVRADTFSLEDAKGGSRGLNQLVAVGRAVADAESIETASGVDMQRARIAVTEKVGRSDVTDYLSVVAFEELAGVLAYTSKGQRLTVIGNCSSRGFSRNDGTPAAEFTVTADRIVLGAKKRSEQDSDPEHAIEDDAPEFERIPF